MNYSTVSCQGPVPVLRLGGASCLKSLVYIFVKLMVIPPILLTLVNTKPYRLIPVGDFGN